jgi:hypothetical protein
MCLRLCPSAVQSLQASIASASASISTVPDVSIYISALTPAVSAYNSLAPDTFTVLQTELSSLESSMQQVWQRPVMLPTRTSHQGPSLLLATLDVHGALV